MSAARRASSAVSSTAPAATDILNDPRVLKHELRQVKIRLRESQATGEEQSQLNVEHAKEIQQQRVYCKRIDEKWGELEVALQAIAEAMRIKMPTPAEIAANAAAAANGASSSASAAAPASALAASSNPVLRVLASRWAALTGSGSSGSAAVDEMTASLKSSDAHAAKSPSATGDEMTDEAVPDAADEGADDEDEAAAPRASFSSENVKLEQGLQQMLQQRAAFTHAILATVVSNLPAVAAPVAPTDLSAQVLALQAERAALQTRLHSAENEVQLLSTTLSEHDALMEAEKEKNKSLRRKLERMQVDLESGDLRKAAASSSSAAAAAAPGVKIESKDGSAPSGPRLGMEGAESVMLDSVADTRPLSPTSLAKFAVPVPALPASSSSSSSAHRYSDQDWRQLKEDMLEFKSLAKHRLEEIHALNKEKSALELDVKKARLAALEDEAAIKNTKIFQELKAAYNNIAKHRTQLTAQVEMAEAQATDANAALRALKAEFDRQMTESQLQSEAALARFAASLHELRSLNHTLEQQNAEWATELPKHPDYAFYQHLRTELLPHMEATLKQQAAAIAQRDTEKKLRESVAASPEEAAADASKQEFGRVLRIWKDQQRKLEAEKTALQEEVNKLRAAATPAAAASSSASAASPAEVSDLRVKLAAATHEAASLRTELSNLQSAPSDVASLQSELVSLQEMNATFGQELNDMSSSVDAATATAARLTAQIVASTATLDKMRSERIQTTQRQASVRNEAVALKAKLEAQEVTLKQATSHVQQLQAQIQALTKEAQRSQETHRTMQQLLEAAREAVGSSTHVAGAAPSSAAAAAAPSSDASAASDAIIASLTAQKVSAALAMQKANESVKLLKGRLDRALKDSGSRKAGAGAGGSSGADADRIKSLKLQLTCQVCETNEKDRIITKCMHMLCNGCVKANLDSRLRKCPTCGLKFGENDVRQIYF